MRLPQLTDRVKTARNTSRAKRQDLVKAGTYRPALDGIRAIAVVAVMLYHGLVTWSRGGFLGVDVFFVLSGYLITSLLLNEWRRWGSVDLIRFYVHRARRLLPALVLVVLAIAGWAAFEARPDRLGTIRADGLSALLYVANWRFVIAQQSYFDQYGDPSPFRHMWSLAIEEQYYLLFPLILIGLLKLARIRRWLLPAGLAAMTVASIVAMATLYDSAADPSRVYYGTDTRMHELLIGSLLAVVMASTGPWRAWATRVAPYAAALGLAGVLASCYAFTDQDAVLYLGGFAGVCVVSALLVAGVELAPRSPVGRLLSLPPVAWVGAISYGLYLWHWPIYIALSPDRTGLDGTRLLLLRMGATLVAAAASYYLVERPIRSGSLRRLPARIGRVLAAVAMPAALTALLVGTVGAVPAPLQASPFPPGTVAADKHSVLVVGDSVGFSYAEALPTADFPEWTVQDSTSLGCGLAAQTLALNGVKGGPGKPECTEQFEKWSGAVEAAKPEAVILATGSWEVFDHVIDGSIVSPSDPAYAGYLTSLLEAAHALLTADGARLYIPNVPCYDESAVQVAGHDGSRVRNDPARARAVNDVLRAFVNAHADDTTLVDDDRWLCPGGKYAATSEGTQLRYDGVHFTSEGGALLWRKVLMPALQSLPSISAVKALTVGDSVPLGLYEQFPAAEYPDLRVVSQTQLGCSAFPETSVIDGKELTVQGNCDDWIKQLPTAVNKIAPDVALVFLGFAEQFDKIVDGHLLEFGTPAYADWLKGQLEARVELFRGRGIPVILPTVPCHDKPDDGLTSTAKLVNDDSRVQANNDLIREVAAEYADDPGPAVSVVDLYGYLCSDGYTNEIDGITLRTDGVHFTSAGSEYVWRLLAPAAQEVAPKPGS